MGRLARSFAHLETKATDGPAFTIHIWDSALSDTPPPPTPEIGEEDVPGAFFQYSDAHIRAGFQLGTSVSASGLAPYPDAPATALSVIDADRDEAWFWVADARRIPYWEEASPIRYLLDWWLGDQGVQVVHAGAVGTPDGVVVLVGTSGSGKSTSSLASLDSTLQYAGDENVAVAIEPRPWIYSLYSTGKLTADHLVRLPFLLPALSDADRLTREKAVVYVYEHWPENTATDFPLRAILAPKIVPGLIDARTVEVTPLAGLAALAPSTIFQTHAGQDSLARMRSLVQIVPSYVLELGSNMSSIPQVIAGLLNRLNT